MARESDERAIRLAVVAHVRHVHSEYDCLLAEGWDRGEARREVEDEVDVVLHAWESGER